MTFPPGQLALLERHLSLVAAWSGRLRLTGALSGERAAEVLVLRDLSVLRHLPETGVFADLGSGAGVPGIPIAVTHPHARIVLVEASRKRAGFLQIVLRDLALANAEVMNTRAEVLGRMLEHRGRYDAVTARAVAPLRILVEYALPLLRIGGVALFPKGAGAATELAAAAGALRLLGGEAAIRPAASAAVSSVIVVRKVAPTPAEYPRRPGTPSRRPL